MTGTDHRGGLGTRECIVRQESAIDHGGSVVGGWRGAGGCWSRGTCGGAPVCTVSAVRVAGRTVGVVVVVGGGHPK